MLYVTIGRFSSEFPYRTAGAQPDEERLTLQELSKDIVRNCPVLVFVQSSRCEFCPPRFSLLKYLTVNGFLEDAFSDYELYKRQRGWVIFRKK